MTNEDAARIIAADQRLSQSLVRHIQRSYFLQNGMRAWQPDVVPHTISSNPVMARAYSKIAFAYLWDCAAANSPTFPLNPDQPIYIMMKFGLLRLETSLAERQDNLITLDILTSVI